MREAGGGQTGGGEGGGGGKVGGGGESGGLGEVGGGCWDGDRRQRGRREEGRMAGGGREARLRREE